MMAVGGLDSYLLLRVEMLRVTAVHLRLAARHKGLRLHHHGASASATARREAHGGGVLELRRHVWRATLVGQLSVVLGRGLGVGHVEGATSTATLWGKAASHAHVAVGGLRRFAA